MKKGIKITLYSFTAIFLGLLVYANWQPKPLHAYAKDAQLSIYLLKKTANEQDLEKINNKLEKVQGISAVAGTHKARY